MGEVIKQGGMTFCEWLKAIKTKAPPKKSSHVWYCHNCYTKDTSKKSNMDSLLCEFCWFAQMAACF